MGNNLIKLIKRLLLSGNSDNSIYQCVTSASNFITHCGFEAKRLTKYFIKMFTIFALFIVVLFFVILGTKKVRRQRFPGKTIVWNGRLSHNSITWFFLQLHKTKHNLPTFTMHISFSKDLQVIINLLQCQHPHTTTIQPYFIINLFTFPYLLSQAWSKIKDLQAIFKLSKIHKTKQW